MYCTNSLNSTLHTLYIYDYKQFLGLISDATMYSSPRKGFLTLVTQICAFKQASLMPAASNLFVIVSGLFLVCSYSSCIHFACSSFIRAILGKFDIDRTHSIAKLFFNFCDNSNIISIKTSVCNEMHSRMRGKIHQNFNFCW